MKKMPNTAASTYCINPDYCIRTDPVAHDDRHLRDEWQDEVYAAAAEYKPRSVLDLGCGSAFKLFKHFTCPFVGVELPSMLGWLRAVHRKHEWREFADGPQRADIVICADVIEHVADPDEILAFIEGCQPRRVFMSTPIRSEHDNGPPENKSHVREWTMQEFRAYLGSRGWNVHEHYLSNAKNRTQLAVCEVAYA